ncbi:hypothetical protein C446_16807 [Halobiforma nitratireducens JCM 10879]|uniref:Halobacterial output domain-containing protein n=2 Tax=Halobiforma nitratireducens TaxID=130048 RepID=M0L8Y2_9EURY|nr:hypothetical protein C446_16807 [Halobiforma nitratireducens JCM 10879]
MEIAHAQFEPTADAVVVSIVETVAAVTDRDSLEMPPLFESVDTEALEVIVASARDRERLLEVTFVYQECLVTVSSGGDVVVEVPEQ